MTIFVCDQCDSRWVGDMMPRRGSICFKCHIKTVRLGFTHGKDDFHGPTVKERQQEQVRQAEKDGRKIEPIGNRWV